VTDRHPLRAVIFDLDNTLLDRSAAHRGWLDALAAARPDVFPPARWAEDRARLIAADGLGYTSRSEYFARLLAWHPGLPAELRERCRAEMFRHVRPAPEVHALLDALGARFRLGLVTNGHPVSQRGKLRAADLERRFAAAATVVTGELGVHKPDPRAFQPVIEALGVAPAEAVYVGDNPTHDVVGARQVGLRSCWVAMGRAWEQEHGPPPDWTVERVQELVEVLP